jgi:hypothetical protein
MLLPPPLLVVTLPGPDHPEGKSDRTNKAFLSAAYWEPWLAPAAVPVIPTDPNTTKPVRATSVAEPEREPPEPEMESACLRRDAPAQ